jgi:hypothetical protein
LFKSQQRFFFLFLVADRDSLEKLEEGSLCCTVHAESSRNFCTAGIWCSEQQHLSELLKHVSSFAIGMLQALLLAA